MPKLTFGIPASPVEVEQLIYAFASHDHRAQVYTLRDTPEDHATLASLIQTGDVIKLVYGQELRPRLETSVQVRGYNLNIEHTNAQS